MIDSHNSNNEKIVIAAPAPTLVCSKCGKEYISRCKRDSDAIENLVPAICPECEKYNSAVLIGGPIGGLK